MRGSGALAACLLGLAALAPAPAHAAQHGGVSLGEVFGGFLAQHFAAAREVAPDATYRVAWYDLNGDGRLEALVYMDGPIWCGPHGCDLLIFTSGRQTWQLAAEISIGTPPISVMEARHHGWRDLKLYVSDSLAPGEERILTFDGQAYRLAPPGAAGRRQDLGRPLIRSDDPGTSLFNPPPSRRTH